MVDKRKVFFGAITLIGFALILNSLISISKTIEPPDSITGKVIYEEALTLEQLKEGIVLSGGWNVFKWTNELESIPVEQGLRSLSDYYYYAYDYENQAFFFNPYQKLADYKNQGYYENRLFDTLKPGKKYAVYMIKDKMKLQYEIPAPEKEEEIEELREEKGLLNNIWFWIIVIVVLMIIFYKKKIWKYKRKAHKH
jgi:hypothetical protein